MTRKKKTVQQKLMDNEGYCLRCKKSVILAASEIIPRQGRLFYIKGTCPQCSNIIVRGGAKK